MMPVRLSAARRAAPLVLLLLPLLSGCGPTRDEFPPVCPVASVTPPTGDLVEYRPNSSGHDLTDLLLQGQIVGIVGKCQPGDSKDRLNASVVVRFEFVRGPAMQGNTLQVPVFIAVTEGDRILTKKVFTVASTFPANVDRIQDASAPLNIELPISATKTGAAYTILAGFQLTPEQLAASRARGQ
jgi:hypothetical protein